MPWRLRLWVCIPSRICPRRTDRATGLMWVKNRLKINNSWKPMSSVWCPLIMFILIQKFELFDWKFSITAFLLSFYSASWSRFCQITSQIVILLTSVLLGPKSDSELEGDVFCQVAIRTATLLSRYSIGAVVALIQARSPTGPLVSGSFPRRRAFKRIDLGSQADLA